MVTDNDYMDQLVKEGPPPAPKRQTTFSKLSTISAVELQSKNIPPLQFLVENFLPTGLTILCSPPKYYKSWMVLDLAIRVANGEPFLLHKTNQSGCLYLALEDGARRLQDRMGRLLGNADAPSNFYFATESSNLETNLLEELEDFLKAHPGVGLIIIDTFQCIRGNVRPKENPYAADYREMASLKQFADRHHVAMLLVHHLRKMKDDGDPFNMISGTNGIMGAADTIFVISKQKRNDDNATLSIVGRDVEGGDTVLTFDKDICRWTVVGTADAIVAERNRRSYETNPIVRTIKALLAQTPTGWQGTMSDLLAAGLEVTGSPLASGPRDLAARLQALDDRLETDGIVHTRIPHGTGGGKHSFRCYTILTVSFVSIVP